MKRTLRRILTGVLSAALVIPMGSTGTSGSTAEAAEAVKPVYQWNFENVEGETVENAGTASQGVALLKGSAKVDPAVVEMAGKKYSADTNHVLKLSGGAKGSSYVELPNNLYEGINKETGLTWSFWMKPDSGITSYSRLFSSTNSQNKNEFAFAPYASDSAWNLVFDDNSSYKHIFNSEPEKNAWNLVTITVSADEVKFYVNGALAESTCGGGDSQVLANRLGDISSLVNNALGKTCSTWTDGDCTIQLDDVSLYDKALTADQVKAAAEGYGIEVSQQKPPVEEIVQDDGSAGMTEIEELETASVDGSNVVRIWADSSRKYYYSAYRNGEVVMKCAPLGLVTKGVDLSSSLELDKDSIRKTKGKEEYDWIQGSSSHVSKEYQETAFTLNKGSSKITMIFRVFEDGMAYRYEVDGDTATSDEETEIKEEISSFVLPDAANIWTMGASPTYEASTYTPRKVSSIKSANSSYGPPILGKVPTNNGDYWVLLAEANVYNEEEPYCASGFKTKSGSTALQVNFGTYLVEETDESLDGKKYNPSYKGISSVKMTDVFHTPWRVAIMTDNLESLVNSSLISDLNPPAEGDFSWVEPGTSSWSWWSTSADEIDYDTMYDYIDYAQETGQKYCLIDFGWEVWKDYETKIRDLAAYAEPKGVGLLLWYGVNKFDRPHKFDLDNPETIEEEFAWCEELGVKGVKVDYINSDSQFAMKVMYDLASIAAKHKLVLNYHGCTDPNGENRTFPNILSSEAVMGSEYFKWGSGSPVQSLLMLPYTRNVIGSMEFTPVGMSVKNVDATDGFMLGMTVVYESAVQTLAHSAYVYPGYGGSSLLAGLPSSWDESRLLAGAPGESVIRARRSGENWYVGAMTNAASDYEISLDFLDPGETYYAYIYTDREGGGIDVETRQVTSDTVMDLSLMKAGGCAIKFSKNDPIGFSVHDGYKYYEAEDAQLGQGTSISQTDYVSGKKFVNNVGGNSSKTVTFEVEALEAGEHECRLFLISPTAKNLYVKVNDGKPIELSSVVAVAGDGNAVAAKSINIDLEEGTNTICLYNDKAGAPGIDRIAISKADLSMSEVTLSKEEYDYSGERNTPAVTVVRNGVTLTDGEDYQVFYSNCKQAGTATVTVVGIGEYAGRVQKTYTIKKAPEPPQVTPAPQNPSGNGSLATPAPSVPTPAPKTSVKKPGKVQGVTVKSKKKKTMTVSFKKLKDVSSYQISYSMNKKWKKAKTIVVKGSVSKKVIKKLKSKKLYYVRVRALRRSGAKKVYGAWSKVKKVKIK